MACPEVDFVYGDALEIDESGKITSPNIFTERPDQDRYVNSHNFICQPTCFFRRSVWQALGPIRKEMKWTFDYDLFGRFFREGFVAERAEAFLAANRSHAETKTSQGLAARYGEIWRMVNRLSDVPFWRRKSLLIYAAELVIKYLQQWRGKKTGVRADLANRNLNRIHLAYHKLVDPREREGIVERYNRLLRERGWIRRSDWLSEMEGESRWTEVGRY